MTDPRQVPLTRRSFFESVSGGICGAALAHLLGSEMSANTGPIARRVPDLRPRQPHRQPKANAVIHLFMNGGPSQMDLYDPKEQ